MTRDYPRARETMVQEELLAKGVTDPRVLAAMGRVPRHRFVAAPMARDAYGPLALPIGGGQTISAPQMVGIMSQALALKGTEKVLEIGTGSGYQAAVLAEMTLRVFTVERVPDLARKARRLLAELGHEGVAVISRDGTQGWKEMGPFDRILVTAGGPEVPRALLDQLAEGGILVIPVGTRDHQELVRVVREGESFRQENLGACIFVPLIGREGFAEEAH
jgi:protein-L-isoaspartate(D-aspartate) O-methyltransferase